MVASSLTFASFTLLLSFWNMTSPVSKISTTPAHVPMHGRCISQWQRMAIYSIRHTSAHAACHRCAVQTVLYQLQQLNAAMMQIANALGREDLCAPRMRGEPRQSAHILSADAGDFKTHRR